jgi:hypothetical protein
MDDIAIVQHINTLAEQEHEYEKQASAGPLSEQDHRTMTELGVQLDQCCDLLRQRRARRGAGLNPDDATVRDAETGEKYRQ